MDFSSVLNLILVKLCNRGEDCIMMIGPMKKKVVTSAVVTGIILILVFVALSAVYIANTNNKIAELQKKGEVVQRYVFTKDNLVIYSSALNGQVSYKYTDILSNYNIQNINTIRMTIFFFFEKFFNIIYLHFTTPKKFLFNIYIIAIKYYILYIGVVNFNIDYTNFII